jgi:hypothetical protein
VITTEMITELYRAAMRTERYIDWMIADHKQHEERLAHLLSMRYSTKKLVRGANVRQNKDNVVSLAAARRVSKP